MGCDFYVITKITKKKNREFNNIETLFVCIDEDLVYEKVVRLWLEQVNRLIFEMDSNPYITFF
jgi:hypothetical protein